MKKYRVTLAITKTTVYEIEASCAESAHDMIDLYPSRFESEIVDEKDYDEVTEVEELTPDRHELD